MKFFLNNFVFDKLLLINYYKNIREISFLKKIVLHFGIKNAATNPKKIIAGYLGLSLISKNRSFLINSKKSVMLLKVRKGMVISSKVTLRNNDMFFFLNSFNLINNFKIRKAWSSSINSVDNFTITLGFSELFFFPNLEKFFDFFDELPFLTVTFVIKKGCKLEAYNLFKLLGVLK
jgi:large subunit ribosomal protein L5